MLSKNPVNYEEDVKNKGSVFYFNIFKIFFSKMKEDKLYLLSFLITIFSVIVFSFYNIYVSEGIYNIPSNSSKDEYSDVTSNFDVSSYVGFYSASFKLDRSVLFDDECSFGSYDLVYRVKSDKSVEKYFVSECVGSVLLWSHDLEYVDSGVAKYVSANGVNYLFSGDFMKEIDGYSYSYDDNIKSLKKGSLTANLSIDYYGNDIIIKSFNNLYLFNGSNIKYVLSDYYLLDNIYLDNTIYREDSYSYKFIVFDKNMSSNCYKEEDINSSNFIDGSSYNIYTIKYNKDSNKFDKEILKYARNKSDGCLVYDEDIAELKK